MADLGWRPDALHRRIVNHTLLGGGWVFFLLKAVAAEATAAAVEGSLGDLGLPSTTDAPTARYYVTDDTERFREIAELFLGERVGSLERVSLSSSA